MNKEVVIILFFIVTYCKTSFISILDKLLKMSEFFSKKFDTQSIENFKSEEVKVCFSFNKNSPRVCLVLLKIKLLFSIKEYFKVGSFQYKIKSFDNWIFKWL